MRESHSTVMGNLTADVVVIGGGIIGSSLALRLAQRKLRVVVLERSQPGSEASSAAAGILSPQAEADGPSPFFQLAVAARDRYPEFARALREATGIDVQLRLDGVLYVATRDGEQEALERRFAWQSQAKLPVERLSASQSQELEPLLRPDLRGGVLFPRDGQVENVRLTRAVILAAQRAGVSYRVGEPARRVRIEGGKTRGVETANGSVLAPAVVNAAGAWAHLDDRLPFPVPIGPTRGEMVSVRPAQLPVRVVYAESAYLVPRLEGNLLIGATMERAGYDKTVKAASLMNLLAEATALLPSMRSARFGSAWAGLRPCTLDQWPILGPTPIEGLFMATGHCRNGILLAPLTAEILAERIETGRTKWNLAPFSVSRFAVA